MTARRPKALLAMSPWALEMQFGPKELQRLHSLAEVPDPAVLDDLDAPGALDRLRDVEVLVTSWGSPVLDDRALDAAPGLRAVFHSAGTVRLHLTEAVWDRGIRVTNAVEENAVPVAEFVLAAIIFAGKKAPLLAMEARTHRDDWDAYRHAHGALSNMGRTIGLIAYSRIGRRVVERLQALEVTTLVYDPFVSADVIADAGARKVELDELLTASDIVSIHAPQLPSTHHMIGARELGLMRDGSTLINTARGSLVDTAALEAECATGRLGAMLDVTDPEPLPAASVLYTLPNVMITPHIAGSLDTETRRMSQRALTELERYCRGLPPEEPVSREELATSA